MTINFNGIYVCMKYLTHRMYATIKTTVKV